MQNLTITAKITEILPPLVVDMKSGSGQFTVQRFNALMHGGKRATLFQLKDKFHAIIASYAIGDHVRIFFNIDGNYLKVFKMEAAEAPADIPPPNRSNFTYNPNPYNNLPQ
jgi:hypothetical protein